MRSVLFAPLIAVACCSPSPQSGRMGAADFERPQHVGVWEGEYTCGQGLAALNLMIEPLEENRISAIFRFRPADSNPGTEAGSYHMRGEYDAAARRVVLTGTEWIEQPVDYVMVDLAGQFSGDFQALSGDVNGPYCTTFSLQRVQ